jgi:hypothetical protein
MAEQYTKTGPQERVGGAGRTWGEFFARWSTRFSFIPLIGHMPSLVAGAIGTALEALGHVFKGQLGSALTAATTGAVATGVNVATAFSGYMYWGNLASGLFTDKALSTYARKGAEGVVGSLSQVLGAKPQVLSNHVAGIGSLDNAYAQNLRGPGQWATRRAEELGRNPRDMYRSYTNGSGAEHVSQLEAARERSAAAQTQIS